MIRRLARRVVRRWLPLPLTLTLIERLGSAYARLAVRSSGLLLPRNVRNFPARVATFVGAQEHDRLVAERLVFLLTRNVLTEVRRARLLSETRRPLPPIDVRGAHHLEAALAQSRGVVLISAHFGLHLLIQPVLDNMGVQSVGAGGRQAPEVAVSLLGDRWDRTRSLQRLRSELAQRRACVLLADTRRGRHLEVPFLGGHLPVGLGAFVLARVADCPLLPYFGMMARGAAPLRVEITPALSIPKGLGAGPPVEAIGEFVHRYESYVRRYPWCLFGSGRLLARRATHPGRRRGSGN